MRRKVHRSPRFAIVVPGFGRIDRRAQIACSMLRCRRTEARKVSGGPTHDEVGSGTGRAPVSRAHRTKIDPIGWGTFFAGTLLASPRRSRFLPENTVVQGPQGDQVAGTAVLAYGGAVEFLVQVAHPPGPVVANLSSVAVNEPRVSGDTSSFGRSLASQLVARSLSPLV